VSSEPSVVLVSADHHLQQVCFAAAAAAGAPLRAVHRQDETRTAWRSAAAVLIGADMAEQIAHWSMPQREAVYIVGEDADKETLCAWSMPLRASVIAVPGGVRWLSRVVLGRETVRDDGGQVVAVAGGSGGVGASTLAAGLAVLAARGGVTAALVDLDPYAGGADLTLGGEQAAGWRWDKLRTAAGQIADITAMMPRVEGVTVVSMERQGASMPTVDAIEAVVDCLARAHALVVVDAGRLGLVAPEVLGMCGRTLVVTGQSVRQVAAARSGCTAAQRGFGIVVRVARHGAIAAGDVASSIGLPLIGTVPETPQLADFANRGVAPGCGGARAWEKACGHVLAACGLMGGRR